jgi:hypothetical protein
MVMTHYRWSGDFDEHCATTPLKEALPITLQLPYNLLSCLFEDEQLRENVYECFLKPPSGAGATRVFYLQDLLSFFNAFGEERNLRMVSSFQFFDVEPFAPIIKTSRFVVLFECLLVCHGVPVRVHSVFTCCGFLC